MLTTIIIGIIVGVAVTIILVFFLLPRIVEQLKENLSSEKREMKTDLENKKEMIEDIAKKIREDLERTKDKLEKAERERVGSFGELREAIENQAKVTEQLSATAESLKRVLSNNQLRGQFGEQVAEELLKMSGFVRGVDYEYNKEQKGSETRPDFTVYLPNKVKINIDVKFPYQNLQKMAETTNAEAKKEHLKMFERDIREKIKQVTSRNYINAEDNTVDFVIMFIPNEMIFSFIYDKMNDLWVGAMKEKVVFAGPFSFTAILRLVRQAYDNFRYQKNVQKIIGYIKNFEIEFKKYNEEFVKIGERIESLSKQYDTVNITRSNQLLKSVDRVKIEEGSSSQLLTP